MTFSPIPSAFLEGLSLYENYILVGHEQPDADCLCSQLGLASFLRTKGKNVRLLAQKPFSRPEISHLDPLFESDWQNISNDGRTLLVLLDLSDIQRTGFPPEVLEAFPLMIIDHHASGNQKGQYCYTDPQSPSTTLMVQKIWEQAGLKPDEETSRYLFLGFATDTGFFRHLESGTEEVFLAVSGLIKQGASPNRTYRQISSGRELGTRRLMGRIMDRCRFYCGNRILISWEDEKDRTELETDERDSDKLYELLQSVEGCEAVALLRMEKENKCIIGLRSNNHIDVGRIASTLGGGGHKKAAGCSRQGSLEEIKRRLIPLFEEQL
jgi:bifunctional oligoribonuclease and PAP phosphatase NrnA